MAPRKKKSTEVSLPPLEKMDCGRKFEYKIISSDGSNNKDQDKLNSLGLEGWELVQSLKEKKDRSFVLKRES